MNHTSQKALIAASLAAAVVACADRAPSNGTQVLPTHDGRYDSQCYGRLHEDQPRYCLVPFGRLIARPEDFDSTHVLVIGFLVRSNRVLALFPSEDSWRQGATHESIVLKDVSSPSDVSQTPPLGGQIDVLKGESGVVVAGRFNARESEWNGRRLGWLENVQRIFIEPGVNPEGSQPEP